MLITTAFRINSSSNLIKTGSIRGFHHTHKKEILPVILGLSIAVVGRYSYRALLRMEEEWEMYEEEINKTHKKHGNLSRMNKNDFNIKGYLGIDLGSTNLRIAYREETHQPKVVEDREGKRSTPAYCCDDGNNSPLLGSLAKSKLYERKDEVFNPRQTQNVTALRALLNQSITYAIQAKIGKDVPKNGFLIEKDFPVKAVLTYPNSELEATYKDLVYPASTIHFVREAIAISHAANFFGLIDKNSGPILVLDVGGTCIQISLVDNNSVILHYTLLPDLGGELLQYALVTLLIRDFFKKSYDDFSDHLALQKLYDAAEGAILELTNASRSTITIPFLSVDNKMQPRHLNQDISLSVLTQEVNSIMNSRIATAYYSSEHFSSHIHPTDLCSYLSSVLMKTFELSGLTPFQIGSVLAVGGGSKSPIYQLAIKKAVTGLAGDIFCQEKLVFPKESEDLCVLGATLFPDILK